jgi:methyl-accepting chemotaxis protein
VSIADWMIVVAAGGWILLVLALCWFVSRAVRAVDEVIGAVRTVSDETVPILRGVNETVSGVNVELARVDTIVAGVQSITATTDQMVGVVHATVTNPVIKAAAVTAGVSRAARSFKESGVRPGGRR